MKIRIWAMIIVTMANMLAVNAASPKNQKRLKYIKYRMEVLEQLSYSIDQDGLRASIQANLEAINIAIEENRLTTTEYDNDDITVSVEREDN